MSVEKIACPGCMAPPSEVVKHRFGALSTVICPGCGLEYVCPRPVKGYGYAMYNSPLYYRNLSGNFGYFDYSAESAAIRATSRRRLQRLRGIISPGRLLEIGAAFGYFLDVAQEAGFEVTAVDVSTVASQHLRVRFERTYRGELQELGFVGEFDCIVAFDTLEHVYEPVALIRAVHAALRPGGFFAFTTPDNSSVWARVLGRRWWSYRVPEHILFFNRRTLSKLLSPYFTILAAEPDRQYLSLTGLAARVQRLHGPLGRFLERVLQVGNLSQVVIQIPNGMKLYITQRNEPSVPGGVVPPVGSPDP